MSERKLFAVVPAAGHSRRMGRPKLLLPLGEKTVIARLLEALDRPEIHCRAVVLRRDDKELAQAVNQAGAWAIQPEEDPPEMRESVQFALTAIAERFRPHPEDGWLLVPADHPVLSQRAVEQMILAWKNSSAAILVPMCQARRGHPVIFSWQLAEQVPSIPQDKGLNWLVRSLETEIQEVPVEDPAILTDLDTPEDYKVLQEAFREQS